MAYLERRTGLSLDRFISPARMVVGLAIVTAPVALELARFA